MSEQVLKSALWMVMVYSVRNIFSGYLRRHPIRSVFLLCFVFLVLTGFFLALKEGFAFILSLGGLGTLILQKLFYILFFIVFWMVGISCAVLFYAVSFRSKETEFLFTLPVSPLCINHYKFLGACFFASWIPFVGLVFFMAGYSRISIDLESMSFIVMTFLYTIPYLFIACFSGYLVVTILLRYFSPSRVVGVGCFLLLCVGIYLKPSFSTDTSDYLYLLSDEIMFFRISQVWFLPSSWAAKGLISFEEGDLFKAALYLILLWSGAWSVHRTFFLKKINIFKALFYKYSVPVHKKRYFRSILDKMFLPKKRESLLGIFFVKDIKQFAREPSLWMQFLIYFGLLFFYFINLRRFSYNLLGPIWINLIVFLNTFSVFCIISAFSVRFIFPQWSLEGRSYWIIRLSPVRLQAIYQEKFFLSAMFLIPLGFILIAISNYMLEVSSLLFFINLYIVMVTCGVIISLSLALGVYFADFSVEYYIRSIESMGGFLTLLCNFSFILGTIGIFAYAVHSSLTQRQQIYSPMLAKILVAWTGVSVLIIFFANTQGIQRLSQKEY